jgi:hypothetical protein
MASERELKNDEEREISRGGKSTAGWTMGLAVVIIAGGIAAAMGIRQYVNPPQRPGTTSATTTAGETKPPSPED